MVPVEDLIVLCKSLKDLELIKGKILILTISSTTVSIFLAYLG